MPNSHLIFQKEPDEAISRSPVKDRVCLQLCFMDGRTDVRCSLIQVHSPGRYDILSTQIAIDFFVCTRGIRMDGFCFLWGECLLPLGRFIQLGLMIFFKFFRTFIQL